MGVFWGKLWYFYRSLREHCADQEFLEQHSPLVEEYRHEGLARFTTLVATGRVALAVPMLVVFSNWAIVQAAGFLALNLAVAGWFFAVRPAQTGAMNCVAALKELIIIGISSLYLFLAHGASQGNFYAYMIIAGMMGIYAIDVLVSTIVAVKSVVQWLCEAGTGPVKIHPEELYAVERVADLSLERSSPSFAAMKTVSSRSVPMWNADVPENVRVTVLPAPAELDSAASVIRSASNKRLAMGRINVSTIDPF